MQYHGLGHLGHAFGLTEVQAHVKVRDMTAEATHRGCLTASLWGKVRTAKRRPLDLDLV